MILFKAQTDILRMLQTSVFARLSFVEVKIFFIRINFRFLTETETPLSHPFIRDYVKSRVQASLPLDTAGPLTEELVWVKNNKIYFKYTYYLCFTVSSLILLNLFLNMLKIYTATIFMVLYITLLYCNVLKTKLVCNRGAAGQLVF